MGTLYAPLSALACRPRGFVNRHVRPSHRGCKDPRTHSLRLETPLLTSFFPNPDFCSEACEEMGLLSNRVFTFFP